MTARTCRLAELGRAGAPDSVQVRGAGGGADGRTSEGGFTRMAAAPLRAFHSRSLHLLGRDPPSA